MSTWLLILCLLILAMIVLGGVTRLTQSGLSMVTWEPLLGAVPPLSHEDWEHRFEQYRAYPEFQKINREMTLAEFKRIYFWEYLHRLAGRSIGLVFLVPYAVFVVSGRVRGGLVWKLFGAFVLGGLQGALGWFMVKSGLVDNPRVSHFRLAAHLGLALLLLGYLYWIRLGLMCAPAPARPGARRATIAFLVLVSAQTLYGAFTAGLDAGYFYNTFPTMNGQWIPAGAFASAQDWVSNPAAVQFLHRTLGIATGLAAVALALAARRREFHAIMGLTLLQVALGIATLLLYVPVWLGALHQLNGALLLLAGLYALHRVRGGPPART